MSALARLLVDFDDPRTSAVAPFADLTPAAAANAAPAQGVGSSSTPPVRQDALEAARAAGLAAGRLAAQEEAEAALAALRAEHETQLSEAVAQARAAWANEQGEALARQVEAAFRTLRDEVEHGVAAVLRPLAEAGAAREAARLMADEIARLMAGGGVSQDGAPLEIAGPADLIDAVRDALDADPRVGPQPSREGRLLFIEADGVDALARLGRVEVETRLAAFARALDRPA